MRVEFFVTVAFVLVASGAAAQDPPGFPPGAEAREAHLMPRVGPKTRAWIQQEARREAAMNELSEATTVSAIRANWAVLGDLSEGDIAAVAFIVLMEASKSAREDLKSIMAGVKQINDAKAGMRQANTNARTEVNRARNSNSPAATATVRPPPSTATPVRPPPAALPIAIQPMPKPEFDAKFAAAKNNLDSLSEMGEMESLRLQMAMDRMSKTMSTLSNMLKKMSDTSSSITQNLK